jgi:hypothetical protein
MFAKLVATLVGTLVFSAWLPAEAKRSACEGAANRCLPNQYCKDVDGTKFICVDKDPCEKVKCLSGQVCKKVGTSAQCVKKSCPRFACKAFCSKEIDANGCEVCRCPTK